MFAAPSDVLAFVVLEMGKIAVNVINHYSDEVLKVYPVKR